MGIQQKGMRMKMNIRLGVKTELIRIDQISQIGAYRKRTVKVTGFVMTHPIG